MKKQKELWSKVSKHPEELFCNSLLIYFRSTNWGEVAKKDYEEKDRPTPPEGQKWEKWQ